MDLLSVLPHFVTRPYAHIIPPLERGKITTVDLITLDTLEIAKRAHVPPADVRRLAASIVDALHSDIGLERAQKDADTIGGGEPSSSINTKADNVGLGPATKLDTSRWNTITTLDPALDALLGGGIPTGYVTEVTGESGSGKTQFLLSLLLAVQLAKPKGLEKRAIYVSTEHPLATNRISQLLECQPYLLNLSADEKPSLGNILSINAMDLETQDHIMNFQVPVAISRYNVGLVVIDSITSNYRAERNSNNMLALSARSTELAKLGQMLRNLAAKENIAIVLANQVSDRFEQESIGGGPASRTGFPSILNQNATLTARESPIPRNRISALDQQFSSSQAPSSSPISQSPYHAPDDERFDGSYLIENFARNEILSLLHQERFFTGWGDGFFPDKAPKTPALGFFWSTQISGRIALKKETHSVIVPWDSAYPVSTPQEQTGSQFRTEAAQLQKPKLTDSPADEASKVETEPASRALNGSEKSSNVLEKQKSLQTHMPAPNPPEQVTRRTMKLVFAPWASGRLESDSENGIHSLRRRDYEVEFEIYKGGLRSVGPDE
ncbi:hypothetical protein N7532_011679 [Penicillium argentinense]|uniref:RecA family profile 1 domain-containing protein n=1 Tax=Penicillium argentinense TaxID=1131581 RepID=A0A9W9JV85_9EURO|nr:uncharacterized protein N7532_011679 [Penicillium argentinense]KAJ5082636.1 hypothetical protein N7532_011679 [Penicillium argentinense]